MSIPSGVPTPQVLLHWRLLYWHCKAARYVSRGELNVQTASTVLRPDVYVRRWVISGLSQIWLPTCFAPDTCQC